MLEMLLMQSKVIIGNTPSNKCINMLWSERESDGTVWHSSLYLQIM